MRVGNRENRNCNWWQKWQVRSGESLHNSSNRFWSGGRRNLLPKLTQYVGEGELCIWFHLFFGPILDLGYNVKTGRLFYHWPHRHLVARGQQNYSLFSGVWTSNFAAVLWLMNNCYSVLRTQAWKPFYWNSDQNDKSAMASVCNATVCCR